MESIQLNITGMKCGGCVSTVEKILKKFQVKNDDIRKISSQLKEKKLANIYSGRKLSLILKNLNDGSNEGISLWDSMAYSVQFHPESGPGTTDGLQIFNPFFEMIENNYAKK